MNKYLIVFKTRFKQEKDAIIDTIFRAISFIFIIYIFLQLWSYIYKDGQNLINGYNLGQMIWYLVIAELITYSAKSRSIVKSISDEIKTGGISYKLNKLL